MLQKSEDIESYNQRLSIEEGQTIQWPNKTKTKNKQTKQNDKTLHRKRKIKQHDSH